MRLIVGKGEDKCGWLCQCIAKAFVACLWKYEPWNYVGLENGRLGKSIRSEFKLKPEYPLIFSRRMYLEFSSVHIHPS
jgi:hypothetical protein